jgi:hypothetical protein
MCEALGSIPGSGEELVEGEVKKKKEKKKKAKRLNNLPKVAQPVTSKCGSLYMNPLSGGLGSSSNNHCYIIAY